VPLGARFDALATVATGSPCSWRKPNDGAQTDLLPDSGASLRKIVSRVFPQVKLSMDLGLRGTEDKDRCLCGNDKNNTRLDLYRWASFRFDVKHMITETYDGC
jgi:hypothetical protein